VECNCGGYEEESGDDEQDCWKSRGERVAKVGIKGFQGGKEGDCEEDAGCYLGLRG
jgi:hypothetical protein